MAEDSEEMFVSGDDFDAILAILEEDEAIDHHFTSVIKESRHRGAATPFSNSLLEGTVAIAVRNINAAGVFAENLRKELSSYVYQPLSESSDQYSFLKALYDDFTKSGNLDKYYSKYYAKASRRLLAKAEEKAEESVAREDVATLRTRYDTGRDLFALKALAALSTFFEFSSSPTSSFFLHISSQGREQAKTGTPAG
ncbi:hypothetical protein P5673_026309 [Acropora cervicornis]|uniref:Uncharacterized protein n=1 Tax=Acropora cervicornis TaxID=6130 RepID=A0AAD9Q106_ACRCE|nr:hypothetical protein P5673_026309 [Acropora cervicornis]